MYALAAVGLFTVMDSLLRAVSPLFPVTEVFLFRWMFALPPILLIVRRGGGVTKLRTRRFGAHVVRATVNTLSLFLFIYAFGHMRLADVIAISFAAPLIVTFLSSIFLGERVDARRWAAVLVGFAGVLVIVRPGGSLFGLNALVALAATFLYAIGNVLLRRMGATESTGSLGFYLAILSIAVGLAAAPFAWVWPQGWQWVMLVLLGLIGGGGNLLVGAAYRAAPVATVAPLDYTMLLGTTVIGYVVFHELPDVWVFVGTAVVAASGIYIIRADTRG